MNVKNMVDVSSFFLFEATGDSEAGVSDPGMPVVYHSDEDDGDEDAESCICDGSDLPVVNKIYGGDHALRGCDAEEEDDEEEENGEVVEQEEVQGCQKWRSDQRIGSPEEQKSTVSVDSKKTMNERERSKLFWETCLAS
ncbi:hypothetical protein SLEP1_g23240 [Rubroshorea leprosula]|uniref:Uncharacterized protein n=1 Tax=Rubroshorea leprosula TaxID=152421 RepID=A0AAV5JH14_9ROSI|nr:hypothetical protein SLEP1_g23240 [Rubroshorea leprosula]